MVVDSLAELAVLLYKADWRPPWRSNGAPRGLERFLSPQLTRSD
jgi:hypothetical protein